MKNREFVAIGLRAKTGRAIAVVVGGSPESPVVLRKSELKLIDPKVPHTAQPYHAVMELRWEESQKAVRQSAHAIERVARTALAGLVKELQANGSMVRGVGVIGSKDRDLARIGNYHIRAHAAEGILFRRVLELAAEREGLPTRTFADSELEKIASSELNVSPAAIKQTLKNLGRPLDPPWRTDEKFSALAAWLMLRR
jgi:hypothetical protein